MTKTTLAVTIVLSLVAAAVAGVASYYVCVATHGNDALMVAAMLAVYAPCVWYVAVRVRADAKALDIPVLVAKSDLKYAVRMAAATLGALVIANATGWYVVNLTNNFALAFATMTPILVAFWAIYVNVLVPASPHLNRPPKPSERSMLRMSLGIYILVALIQPFSMWGNFSMRLHDSGTENTLLILGEFSMIFLFGMTATLVWERLQRIPPNDAPITLTPA
jgi:hypothetical protein